MLALKQPSASTGREDRPNYSQPACPIAADLYFSEVTRITGIAAIALLHEEIL